MQWTQLLLPLALLAFMYFLMIRPQQQQAKKRNEMLANLKSGDKVTTIGGLQGTIVAIDDKIVTLDCGGNVKLTFNRSAIGSIRES